MAILPVTLDDIESTSVVLNPLRTYISSSNGVTGSINLFPRSSTIEKEIRPLENFNSSMLYDDDIEEQREDLAAIAVNLVQAGQPIAGIESYVENVRKQSLSSKKQKKIEIDRFTPTFNFTKDTVKKLNVKDLLMPYYRSTYPTMDWAYTNYHSLNFFTSSGVPSTSALLYPSVYSASLSPHAGYVTGAYALSGAFSFDFYINPRLKPTQPIKAGTIFHLSSSYALSLITGSKDAATGHPGYRLMLQLSHSADVSPSIATPGSYPNDLIFLSDDNSLEWNKWHRVVVRWGTDSINDGTGSFNIDNIEKGIFVIPSATIMPQQFSTQENPVVLCLGNYYEGTNYYGVDSQTHFFADVPAEREGLFQLIDNGATQDEPSNYLFDHPLNAELHDVVIRRYHMSDYEIKSSYGKGLVDITSQNIAFYVPSLFVENTPIRKRVVFPSGSTYGGVLQTPFFEIDGSTDDPFNVAMAFGVGGHYINLENFVKDFANNSWPRLHHLSGTAITYTTTARSANEFLYDDEKVRKRNLTVLPCDDGNFDPNYLLISNEIGNKYVDAFGRYEPSLINLENLLNQKSLVIGSLYDAEKNPDFLNEIIGFSPENPGLPPGAAIALNKAQIEEIINTDSGSYGPGVQKNIPLTIYQRLKDSSSDQITFFSISNMFYGKRIKPGSFVLTDKNLSGSSGGVKITLRDDGFGGLYRADSVGEHAKWNNIGNIFYDEGVVVIKSPHLYFFGKNEFEMSFKGEHSIHTMKYEVLAPYGLLNSSSNPTYIPISEELKPSSDITDNDIFVYISDINFHDDNLNVVAKATLAQPVIKRETEKLLFKIGFDF